MSVHLTAQTRASSPVLTHWVATNVNVQLVITSALTARRAKVRNTTIFALSSKMDRWWINFTNLLLQAFFVVSTQDFD